MEFHLPGLPARRDTLEAEFLERVAQPMGMDVRLTDAARPKRVAPRPAGVPGVTSAGTRPPG